MPSWGEILQEIHRFQPPNDPNKLDKIRRKYLLALHQKTGRPVILYATKWVQPSAGIDPQMLSISIEDVQGLMEVMRGITATELDLIIHSPGGAIDAAEALVSYLRSKFAYIRAIIPYAAMSAATMIACAANEILMGKHSFLGPIDPQFVLQTPLGVRMVPAQAILDQFGVAQDECSKDPSKLASWVPMLSQYGPDLLVQCQNASALSQTLVEEWLAKYMLSGNQEKAAVIAEWLSTHGNFKTHSRYLNRETLLAHGLDVKNLEDDQEVQDLVLSVYHATSHSFDGSPAVKIIENHNGRAFIKLAGQIIAPPLGMPLPLVSPPNPTL
ncbi:MAG: serine protease [Betaproteobacteria bacterium]|nr:serine protease [Betaproteobacteria bacterium]